MQIQLIHHSSIKLIDDKIIYIDPYKINKETHDADYIFITHDHYDHYDEESINKIKKDTTKIIVPKILSSKNNNLVVEPNKEYMIDDISFKTISSYNLGKDFHPKDKEYVGFNILLKGTKYYIMGDTDITPECLEVDTDICFVPIGGIYTMDYLEASEYINKIKPKKAIPIHYGMIVGDYSLGEKFKEKVDKEIEVDILLKGEDYYD